MPLCRRWEHLTCAGVIDRWARDRRRGPPGHAACPGAPASRPRPDALGSPEQAAARTRGVPGCSAEQAIARARGGPGCSAELTPRGHVALRRAHAARTRGTPPSIRSVPGLGHDQAARYVLWHLEDVGLLPPRVLLPGGGGCGPGIPGPWRTPDSMSPTVAPGHGTGKRCLRCRGYAQKSKWGRGIRHHRS